MKGIKEEEVKALTDAAIE